MFMEPSPTMIACLHLPLQTYILLHSLRQFFSHRECQVPTFTANWRVTNKRKDPSAFSFRNSSHQSGNSYSYLISLVYMWFKYQRKNVETWLSLLWINRCWVQAWLTYLGVTSESSWTFFKATGTPNTTRRSARMKIREGFLLLKSYNMFCVHVQTHARTQFINLYCSIFIFLNLVFFLFYHTNSSFNIQKSCFEKPIKKIFASSSSKIVCKNSPITNGPTRTSRRESSQQTRIYTTEGRGHQGKDGETKLEKT